MKEVKLREICRIEKGKQIDTSQLRTDSPYKYINGGIKESGYYHEYNTDSEAVLVSEGGASCGYVNYVAAMKSEKAVKMTPRPYAPASG